MDKQNYHSIYTYQRSTVQNCCVHVTKTKNWYMQNWLLA